jgi:DNA modification methylase
VTVQLLLGPAASVLKRDVPTASVDLIYSDPPFGNEQVWTGKAGAFSDKWSWDSAAAAGWECLQRHSPAGADLMRAIATTAPSRAYLGTMADLLLECRRVLKATGTLWLHFDDTMGAHLRVLGDVVFGVELQLGTVVWRRSSSHNSARAFGRIHDTIACFAKSRAARWHLARCGGELVHGDPCIGVFVDGLLDDRLTATATERVGYPTQKPVSLLERIVRSASLPGELVLDPTCGSGTTLVAAQRLRRRALGIDVSPDAIATATERLKPPARQQFDLFEAAA